MAALSEGLLTNGPEVALTERPILAEEVAKQLVEVFRLGLMCERRLDDLPDIETSSGPSTHRVEPEAETPHLVEDGGGHRLGILGLLDDKAGAVSPASVRSGLVGTFQLVGVRRPLDLVA